MKNIPELMSIMQNIPKLKQRFEITYEYKQNNTVIVCYVRPCITLCYLGELTRRKPKVYKGVARLKEGDLPCLEEGQQIAKRKAMRAYYKDMKNTYAKQWYEAMSKAWTRLLYMKQIEDKIKSLTQEIEEIAHSEK